MNKISQILIIDDEQIVLDSLSRIIRTLGIECDIALNGEDGLTLSEKNNYQLIICDIMLPDMNGFRVMESLIRANKQIPLVFTSGYSTLDNAIRGLKLGALEFLPKPFSFEEVLAMMQRAEEYYKLKYSDIKEGDINYIPIPSSYYRLGEYCWVAFAQEGEAIIGLSDLGWKVAGDITGIEMVNTNAVKQGEGFIKINTIEGTEHYYPAPISGRIIFLNDSYSEAMQKRKDPYFDGWVVKVVPDNQNEKENLILAASDRL